METKEKKTRIVVWVVILAGLAALSLIGYAGSLEPSAPPGPTMKTLDQVEPRIPIAQDTTPGKPDSTFAIVKPGSYYLTGNIQGESGKNGITVEANNVSIDLTGFTLQGVAGSLDGITVPSHIDNLAVRNGTIAGWGGDGVDATRADNSQFEKLHLFNNGNGGAGLGEGLMAGLNAVVSGCTAKSNTGRGIDAHNHSTIIGCAAYDNGGKGILAFGNPTVVDCTAAYNYGGITAEGGVIANCSASHNTYHGFSFCNLGPGTIVNCTARGNGDLGILLTSGSTARGCTSIANTNHGILAPSDCLIVGNLCQANGAGATDAAGIYVSGCDNRIEGNNVTDNDRGIDVDDSNNIIIKNTASGNTGR
ncbi:MAG: right-handed parallel beta-helix repeat-containing protein, partial [Planctomycetota bacterium]